MKAYKLLAAAAIFPASVMISTAAFAGPCGVSPTKKCEGKVKEINQEYKEDRREARQEFRQDLREADTRQERREAKLEYKGRLVLARLEMKIAKRRLKDKND